MRGILHKACGPVLLIGSRRKRSWPKKQHTLCERGISFSRPCPVCATATSERERSSRDKTPASQGIADGSGSDPVFGDCAGSYIQSRSALSEKGEGEKERDDHHIKRKRANEAVNGLALAKERRYGYTVGRQRKSKGARDHKREDEDEQEKKRKTKRAKKAKPIV